MKKSSVITRELVTIIVSSIFLALIYNTFSPKSIPLIRTEPKKIAASDSALFPTQHPQPSSDTSIQSQFKVIAPLHERALKNPDSMAAVVKREREKREEIFKIVTLDQVKRLLAQGRGLFIDARDPESYRKGHIKGARNIFGDAPDRHFEELVEIPRDTLIVIYCNNPECHLGRVLAEFMNVMEFNNLYLYDDGWDGWEEANMPIDTTSAME
ncbi:MAG: rhodanese-like domain-containing protein [Ignavibacteriae bacterium]|nr:rhodanese-like domain-containing protein [Ignavibacteriota bacterium]